MNLIIGAQQKRKGNRKWETENAEGNRNGTPA